MSIARTTRRLELPGSLQRQLRAFRGRVWAVKMAEAAGAALFGLMAAYLILYGLDRVWDTPAWPRFALFLGASAALALLPGALYRWVWRRRRPEQLARLIGRSLPGLGDQLLGAIELVRNDDEQARSPALCEAAVQQVAEDTGRRDLRDAVPRPWHRAFAAMAAVPTAAAVALLALWPEAARNAWARLAMPWEDVPRYTFARVEPLPGRIVIPHGEPFTLAVRVDERGAWRPETGEARVGSLDPIAAVLDDGRYAFELPPLLDARPVLVTVGDAVLRTRVEPMLRPELSAVEAEVTLPGYLQRPGAERKDVRGGSLALVKGGSARVLATAGRPLAGAEVDGRPVPVSGSSFAGPVLAVEGPREVLLSWEDEHGLAGKAPFALAIDGRDDEAPVVSVEGMPQRAVVLVSEQLTFTVRARDDFGIRRVGLEWRGADASADEQADHGEQVLAAGGPDRDLMDVEGVFAADSLGIAPQPVVVRMFAEDYLPERPRAYSPEFLLYVLSAEDHAIWLTEQFDKWHRRSLEVRDREMQLLETNKQLRALTPEQLDQPGTRREIEAQAAAERANGRKLDGLVDTGEGLLQQAMRNPEFGVGHLETMAEMMQVLKDIAGNRMPSVADLLDEAARAPSSSPSSSENKQAPMAGEVRATGAGGGAPPEPEEGEETPPVPQVVDVESSQQPPEPSDGEEPPPPPGGGGSPRLTLPTTTLMGTGGPPPEACPPAQKLDEAIREQEDLLAEFEKVAGELNRVLGNLEGSTLVKRLKAAAREEIKVADQVGAEVDDAFGRPEPAIAPEAAEALGEAAERQLAASTDVSYIMDDMQAYFERRRLVKFRDVLDEMREQDVVGNLRDLGEQIAPEAGLAIARCEFWSDTLDRWAEDLVDPASGGT